MNRAYLCALLCWFTYLGSAQVEFGLKAGINSIDLITNGIKVDAPGKNLTIEYLDSDYGYHFGAYTRISLLGLYIEPAAIFNSNSVNYKITNLEEGELLSKVVNEKFYKLDLPINVGVKAGIFRLYGGPVSHIHLLSSSDLIKIKDFEKRINTAKFGYQAGFGFDLWKLRLDVAYEGNLGVFGDHISIGGKNYSFDNSESRLITSVGFKF